MRNLLLLFLFTSFSASAYLSGGTGSGGAAAEFNPFDYDLTYGSFTEAGVVPWRTTNGGADSGVANFTSTLFAGHAGVARHQTGSTTTGYATLHGQEQVLGPGAVFKTTVRVEDLSTAGEEYIVLAGYSNSQTAAATATGIYFTYDRLSSVNWRCHTVAATTETATSSSTAVSVDTWVDLEIRLSVDRTSATFYVNDTLVCTHTTNIPPNTDYNYPMVKIVKSAGTTDRIMYTDFMYDKQLK